MNDTKPAKKKIRSQLPDVVVAVGSGESMQEFHCYRVILSFASEYFDSMLSASMIENKSGRIEFPNKEPQMWKKFYAFIDPDKLSAAETLVSIDVSNAFTFVPWFHEFQMANFLSMCDKVLARRVEEIRADENEFIYATNSEYFDSNSDFEEIVALLKLSCTYDLDTTKEKAEDFVCSLIENIQRTSDLFDQHRIKSLCSLFSPLQKEECNVEHEDGQMEILRELIPIGKSKRICNAFLNMPISFDKPVLIYHLVAELSIEILSDQHLFPLLLHSYVIRSASVATALKYKNKLAEKDSVIARKDTVIAEKETVIKDLLQKITKTPRGTGWRSPSAAEYWQGRVRNGRSA